MWYIRTYVLGVWSHDQVGNTLLCGTHSRKDTLGCSEHTNLFCDIVDDNDSICPTVVAGHNGPESLLTCCIPLQGGREGGEGWRREGGEWKDGGGRERGEWKASMDRAEKNYTLMCTHTVVLAKFSPLTICSLIIFPSNSTVLIF